ncbi:FG-GAP-like repeat-containing protein [Parafrankia discariae]|uniref:FG-GAP-like repeat-containing protein n=1 Tax=Parafrankia discariae TaxID=365528 RepID=UPI0012B68D9D|nr:FG-GAP-like repeat-containing protein [Parafrankia discariae]
MPDTVVPGHAWPARRRAWGMIMVAIIAAVAMIAGMARPSVAADGDAPPTSVTIDMPVPHGFDRAKAQIWVDEINGRHPKLSDTVREELENYPLLLAPSGGLAPPFTVWRDYDGALAATSTGVSLTIDGGEVQATDWADMLIGAFGMAAAYYVRAWCLAIAGASGAGAIPGAVVCTSFGGFVGTFSAGVLGMYRQGALGSWKDWGYTLGAATLAALGGGAWEKWLSPWVKANGGALIQGIWQSMRTFGLKLAAWWPSLGGIFTNASAGMAANAGPLLEGIIAGLFRTTNATDLRVMPLGDSITLGTGSSTRSSYRGRLWDQLHDDVDSLDYVGSVDSGSLADTDNEGHSGWTISQITNIVCRVRQYRPNVVTLHVGTNDMSQNLDVAGAPDRLRRLISAILDTAPETTVLVATLVPSTDAATNTRIQSYNAAIPGVVTKFEAAGRAVHLVDMSAVGTADMNDSLHPNDTGYRKMGDAFYKTIGDVLKYDAFRVPQAGFADACGSATGGAGGTTNPVDPSQTSQEGWRYEGQIVSGVGASRDEVRFADINGDGLDDYLVVDAQGRVRAWLNNRTNGSTSWTGGTEVVSGVGASRDEVRFADVNGDGFDDYLVVGAQGQVRAWINNRGNGSPSWTGGTEIAAGVGASRDEVRFADIDGDGRDDYLVLGAQGQVRAWLNDAGPGGPSWAYKGEVASGVGATREMVRLIDLDGDSRADYLVVDDQGGVRAWLNTYGSTSPGWVWQGQVVAAVGAGRANVEFARIDGGSASDYLVVNSTGQVTAWVNQRFDQAVRWGYQGLVASGVGATPDQVRFADLNGDHKDDYLVVGASGELRAWLNNHGGTGAPWLWQGESGPSVGASPATVRFADLNGDGRDDYLVVGDQGQVRGWLNNRGGTGAPWLWKGEVGPGVGASPATVRFADFNGDGRDDYLVVGAGSQVQGWLNTAGGSTGVTWTPAGDVAAGIGLPGSLVTFADIDGDHRDDYLITSSTGRIWAWLNRRGSGGAAWAAQGEIASGVGVSRDQLNLVDYNGDGRDDYLALDAAGAVTAWANNGIIRKG